MNITANENKYKRHIANVSIIPLSKRLQYVVCIVFIGRDFHYMAI